MRFGVLITIVFLGGCGPAPSLQEQYSGPWVEPTAEVMSVLAKNQTRGCGEFFQKANSKSHAEFAVACNRMPDGSGKPAWVGYLVWTASEKVQGPDFTAVDLHFGGPPRADPR